MAIAAVCVAGVVKGNVAPIGRVVTVGALPVVMVHRRRVAGLAIGVAGVVKGDVAPVGGVVA